MQTKQAYTGRTKSVPAGMSMGLGLSLVITAAAIAVLSKLVDGERLAWENVGYGIMTMLATASFAGAMMAYGSIKRQRLLVCLLTGAAYFCTLLSLTALLFGGQYEGVGATFLLILGGSGCAGLLGLRQGRGGAKNHRLRRKSSK